MTTFPIPIPARAIADSASNDAVFGANARVAIPIVVNAMASRAARSRPVRLARNGVANPNTANIAGGSIPTTPITASPNCRSVAILPNRGLMDVTAARSVSAERTMAANTSSRPRTSDVPVWVVSETVGALTA